MHLIFLWIVLALFWSGSYAAVKIGLDGFGPFTMVAGRLLIGAALLFIILRFRSGRLPLNGPALLAYAVPAVFGNLLPFLLIGFGELHVDSGLAALLMGIAPVATVFLSPLLIPDEHLTPRSLLGIGFDRSVSDPRSGTLLRRDNTLCPSLDRPAPIADGNWLPCHGRHSGDCRCFCARISFQHGRR